MSLYVNTNVSAINAQRQLITSGTSLDTAFKRLSSGFRINSAADDAAGYNFNNLYGFGRVDAGAAVAMAKNYTVNLGEEV
ncbi:hypothetical protein SD53_04890, partial [Rheinheimera mesophila]